jgi:hypothetical protein
MTMIADHIERAGRAVRSACFEAHKSCPESQVADALADASAALDAARRAVRAGERALLASQLEEVERVLASLVEICEWSVSTHIEVALARTAALRETVAAEAA